MKMKFSYRIKYKNIWRPAMHSFHVEDTDVKRMKMLGGIEVEAKKRHQDLDGSSDIKQSSSKKEK